MDEKSIRSILSDVLGGPGFESSRRAREEQVMAISLMFTNLRLTILVAGGLSVEEAAERAGEIDAVIGAARDRWEEERE